MAPARRGNVRVYAAVMALVGALGLFVPAASGESALAPESFQPERTGAVLILSPVEGATYSARCIIPPNFQTVLEFPCFLAKPEKLMSLNYSFTPLPSCLWCVPCIFTAPFSHLHSNT